MPISTNKPGLTYKHLHTYACARINAASVNVNGCTIVFVHICIYVWTYAHTRTHARKHTLMYVRMFECMYLCMCTGDCENVCV